MNLTGQPPRQKPPKPAKAPDYLARVRDLPCCICEAFGEVQQSATTAHHVIHGRYQQTRTPDVMAIPLCDGHHQGNYDKSKIAIHAEPVRWKFNYGLDTDYTAGTQDRLDRIPE